MRLRIARHTDRLDEVAVFYRDRLGFPEIARFENHDGYDGVILEIPGTSTHLELTAGGDHSPPAPHPESLIVLFLESQAAIELLAGQLGQPNIVPANPYWQLHAKAFLDPDGFQVLLALSDDPTSAIPPE